MINQETAKKILASIELAKANADEDMRSIHAGSTDLASFIKHTRQTIKGLEALLTMLESVNL